MCFYGACTCCLTEGMCPSPWVPTHRVCGKRGTSFVKKGTAWRACDRAGAPSFLYQPQVYLLGIDFWMILCYNNITKLILKGGGQNDKLNTDKINCRFVHKLTYIVTSWHNALDFIEGILFL